jgi:tetratricopeptide (TPR) repeat protein
MWHGYWAVTLSHIGRLREAASGYGVAIDCLQRLGRRDAIGSVMSNVAGVYRSMGRIGQALTASQQAYEFLRDDPNQTSAQNIVRLILARNQGDSGRFAESLQNMDEVLPQINAMGGAYWPGAAATQMASLWLMLGQFARAVQALQSLQKLLDGMPGWMQAVCHCLRMEVADASAQPLPHALVAQALTLTQGDANRSVGLAVRALRAAGPEDVLAQVKGLSEHALRQEQFGLVLAANGHWARAASALHLHDEACAAAERAGALLQEGHSPEAMYLPEVHLWAGRALAAAGQPQRAAMSYRAGADWVRQQALPHVPAPFIDSFLHRNPVNRDLLAAVVALG